MDIGYFLTCLITGALGTVGFALIFRLRVKHLPFAVLGAIIAYSVYYFVGLSTASLMAVTFIASTTSALYSEICARILRAPSIIFAWLCVIPIIPGASLYYAMSNVIKKDYLSALSFLYTAITVSLGIAGGILAVSIVFSFISMAKRARGVEASKNKK